MDREIQEQLYDPSGMSYREFVKKHSSWRVKPGGLLDLKRIAAAWQKYKRQGRLNDPAPRGYRQSIASESQRAAMFAEIDRREKRGRTALRKARRDARIVRKRRQIRLKSAHPRRSYVSQKGRRRFADPAPQNTGGAPRRWFEAMRAGIERSSDVEDPDRIVRDIWRRLSPMKRAKIKIQDAAGKSWKYDLPLPIDRKTHGTGVIRTVQPFKLAEVQANVSPTTFQELEGSGLFEHMKRQDGSTALVKRCKSEKSNCNIFIDKAGV